MDHNPKAATPEAATPEAARLQYSPLKGNEIRLIKMTGSEEDGGALDNELKLILKLLAPQSVDQTTGENILYNTWTGERQPESVVQIPPKMTLSIEHVDPEDCPPFLALSYVWGEPEAAWDITVDGKSVRVPINLIEALAQIFDISRTLQAGIAANTNSEVSPDEDSLFLWADSICINQADLAERSRQVPRMNDIYDSAYNVIVWLGNFEKLSRYNGLHVASTHHLLVDLMETELPDGFPKQIEKWKINSSVPKGPFEDLITCYRGLMLTPWFRRVWVLQEYALSRRQPCALIGAYLISISALYEYPTTVQARFCDGTLELSPEEAASLPDWIRSMEDTRDTTWTSAALRRQLHEPGFQAISPAEKLLAMVTKMGGKGATMPHDYIYGLLGMIHADIPALPTTLTPDYTLPFARVFADYARFIINETHDLRILMDRVAGPERLEGVPSWVPDPGSFPARLAYEPEPQTRHIGNISPDGKVLTAQGTQVSFIIHLFAPFELKDEDGELLEVGELLERFYTTDIGGAAMMSERGKDEVVKEWFSAIHQWPNFTPARDIEKFWERYPTFDDYIVEVYSGRLFVDFDDIEGGRDVAVKELYEEGEEEKASEEARGFDRLAVNRFLAFNYALDTDGRVSILYCCQGEKGIDANNLTPETLTMVWALKGSTRLSVLQGAGTEGEYRYVGWLDREVRLDEEFFEGRFMDDVRLV